jgi:hypothetical protein
MKSKQLTPTKNKAQAMVEFAIALPILLMLLYGILEVGRLLFTYSSVVNATRQSVRWGSTIGTGDRGTPNDTSDDLANVKRYQDCDGIRASAQRGDFLDVFDDEDITITYDMGPGVTNTLPDQECNGSYDVNIELPTGNAANTARIMVSINADFNALVPKLVAFIDRTITAESARTIVTSITITGPSGGLSKKSATIFILDVPDPSEVGQNVTVTVTLDGDGVTTPTGTVEITGADTNCTITLSGGTGSCIVVFQSVGSKTITATYSGDATYDGRTNDEPHQVNLAYTNTTITSDTPDPSLVNGTVNVNVLVTSGAWAGFPTGTVTITGADTNCTINLSGGTGNCLVTFTSAGSKTITATYNGDTRHLGSFDTEDHTVVIPTAGPSPTNTVGPAPTKTNTPQAFDCKVTYVVNQWDTGFTANIIIKNNTNQAIKGYTLSWIFTAGQQVTSGWNATFTQSGNVVDASNPADAWNGTIAKNGGTQQFGFQGTHTGSNPPPANFTLNGVACSGGIDLPTATPIPSFTPSPIATPIACNQVSHGPLSYSGNTMNMTIDNQTGVALAVQDVTVTWNHDEGQAGFNTLPLLSASLGSSFWSGSQTSTSYTITPGLLTIPTGASTITFTFEFDYANQDGSERIFINLSTPGCTFIDSDI